MSISTQLTRLARNVGTLTADTNAIFEALRAKGVIVPADAQLSDVADMIEEIEVPNTSVEIGGRSYPVVRIGNQLWLAENLDWKFSGCVIGASGTSESEPRGNYYNNDEVTYGINGNKYGLLYNQIAVNQINNLLTDGWHVPTRTDYSTLADTIGGTSTAGTKLKSISGWTSGNGTDDYGMCIVPCGDYAGTFANLGTGCSIWTEDSKSSSIGYNVYFTGDSSEMRAGEPSRYHQMSLRLVKDAPGYVTIGDHQYKTVTIENQEWLAENLDLINSQVTGSYPNNDSQTYGYNGLKYGAYYNEAQYTTLSSYIQTNYPEWRIATEADYKYLDSLIGSSIGMDLCSTTEWNSTQGNDTYGLNLRPTGYITYTNTFSDEHNAALLRHDTGHCWIMPSYSSFEYYKTDQYTGPCSFNVRLVRDIT